MPPRFCQNCGAELTENARFCTKCGGEVSIQSCQSCGAELPEDARFCTNCGNEAILAPHLEKRAIVARVPAEKRPRMRWQVRLAIMLPILIVLGAFIFNNVISQNQTVPPPSPNPTPRNDSLVTGQVIAARPLTGSYPWEIDIKVQTSEDVPGFPTNFTETQIGKVITALTKEDASKLKGQVVSAYVNMGGDEWHRPYYARDISISTVLVPPNNSLVTGRVIAVRATKVPLPWEIDIEVKSSEDVPGYPSNLTKSQIGKVITVLTKQQAPQFDGKEIITRVMWRDDTWGKFFYTEDISLPPDTTPPPQIVGLKATATPDGKVVLSWDKSTAADFQNYSIYISKSSNTDVSGLKPVLQISEISRSEYQATGLEPNTAYYFAVTAVDTKGNENKRVIVASATPYTRVVLDVPALVSTPDEAIRREFTWKCQDIDWEWKAEIPGQIYQVLHDKPRPRTIDYSIYVTHSLDDSFFQALAAELMEEGQKLSFTNEQKVELALLFVQAIPYSTDNDTTGLQEYPRYPVETLVESTGDCEDHAILLAELLRCMNYDAILLEYRGDHMAVGIADTGNMYGRCYEYNGKSYFYAETTATGWKIGDLLPGYERAAYVWELVPTPSLGCVRFGWPNFTGTMPLNLTIYNDGTAPAIGVTVYAELQKNEEWCYAQAETKVDIPAEETREVTLYLKLSPQPIQTRVRYAIMHNGRKLAEGFSDWQYFSSGG